MRDKKSEKRGLKNLRVYRKSPTIPRNPVSFPYSRKGSGHWINSWTSAFRWLQRSATYLRCEPFYIRWLLRHFQRLLLLKITTACGFPLLPSKVSTKLYGSVWFCPLLFPHPGNASCYISLSGGLFSLPVVDLLRIFVGSICGKWLGGREKLPKFVLMMQLWEPQRRQESTYLHKQA